MSITIIDITDKQTEFSALFNGQQGCETLPETTAALSAFISAHTALHVIGEMELPSGAMRHFYSIDSTITELPDAFPSPVLGNDAVIRNVSNRSRAAHVKALQNIIAIDRLLDGRIHIQMDMWGDREQAIAVFYTKADGTIDVAKCFSEPMEKYLADLIKYNRVTLDGRKSPLEIVTFADGTKKLLRLFDVGDKIEVMTMLEIGVDGMPKAVNFPDDFFMQHKLQSYESWLTDHAALGNVSSRTRVTRIEECSDFGKGLFHFSVLKSPDLNLPADKNVILNGAELDAYIAARKAGVIMGEYLTQSLNANPYASGYFPIPADRRSSLIEPLLPNDFPVVMALSGQDINELNENSGNLNDTLLAILQKNAALSPFLRTEYGSVLFSAEPRIDEQVIGGDHKTISLQETIILKEVNGNWHADLPQTKENGAQGWLVAANKGICFCVYDDQKNIRFIDLGIPQDPNLRAAVRQLLEQPKAPGSTQRSAPDARPSGTG